jgi:hypothetical protein
MCVEASGESHKRWEAVVGGKKKRSSVGRKSGRRWEAAVDKKQSSGEIVEVESSRWSRREGVVKVESSGQVP